MLRRLLLIWAVMIGVGCAGEVGQSATSGWSIDKAWTLGSQLLVIGGDTLPGHDLFRVGWPVRAPDGNVVLADGSTNEIRVFDSSGRLVSSFGGTGGGPEEFRGIARLWLLPPDTVMTFDGGSARVAFWSMSGTLLSSVSLPLELRPNVIRRTSDGSFIGVLRAPIQRRSQGELWIDSVSLIRIAADGMSHSELGKYPQTTTYAGPSPTGSGQMNQNLPLEPRGYFVAHDSAVFVGYSDKWEITRLNLDGSPNDTLRRSAPRRAFTQELKERWMDELAARGTPDQQLELRQFFSAFPTPDSLPTYDRLMVDDEGCLWVRANMAPGAATPIWSVFSPDSRWLGEVILPQNLEPTHIGSDFVVGLARGEDDVELVVVFALDRKRTGGPTD